MNNHLEIPRELRGLSETKAHVEEILWLHAVDLISLDQRDITFYTILKGLWDSNRTEAWELFAHLLMHLGSISPWDYPPGVQDRYQYLAISLQGPAKGLIDDPEAEKMLDAHYPINRERICGPVDKVLDRCLSQYWESRYSDDSKFPLEKLSSQLLGAILDQNAGVLPPDASDLNRVMALQWILVDTRFPLPINPKGLRVGYISDDKWDILTSVMSEISVRLRSVRAQSVTKQKSQAAWYAVQDLRELSRPGSALHEKIQTRLLRAAPNEHWHNDTIESAAFVLLTAVFLEDFELLEQLMKASGE